VCVYGRLYGPVSHRKSQIEVIPNLCCEFICVNKISVITQDRLICTINLVSLYTRTFHNENYVMQERK
jgi:hypothetical protein